MFINNQGEKQWLISECEESMKKITLKIVLIGIAAIMVMSSFHQISGKTIETRKTLSLLSESVDIDKNLEPEQEDLTEIISFSFNEPVIKRSDLNNISEKENFDKIIMDGLDNLENPGEPVLPFKSVKILIPQDKTIDNIEVITSEKVYLNGQFLIEPGQNPIPLSYFSDLEDESLSILDIVSDEDSLITKPDVSIYDSKDVYPAEVYSQIVTQSLCGYNFVLLNLYPVHYIPQSRIIYYFEEIDVKINYQDIQVTKSSVSQFFRNNDLDRNRVTQIVDNPTVEETYSIEPIRPRRGCIPQVGESYDYVIITSEELKNADGNYTFQDLVDWKISKGLNATIVTVEEIMNDSDYDWDGTYGDGTDLPQFNDTAAHIRNFIKDAYIIWNTTYVLLGGDGDGDDVGGESGDNIIPARCFYCRWDDDYPIPADMYYSNLDGSFDYDNDGFFGEPGDGVNGGEVDLYSEILIGRAPVDSVSEVSNFVRKTISYENTSTDDPYVKKALFVGEHLGFFGEAEYACNAMEELRHGSDDHGYSTEGLFEGYTTDFLYDKLYYWEKSELISKINNNVSIINHLGHGNNYHVMKFDEPVIMRNGKIHSTSHDIRDNLTNNKYFFAYSQACSPGAFDNWYGDYKGYDSIAEHLVSDEHGAFSVIMNSRYGWGKMATTDGASQRYHRQFWDAFSKEGFTRFSEANQDSKEDNIGYLNPSKGDVMRWCYYELNLLGDPETQIKTNYSNPQVDIKNPITGSVFSDDMSIEIVGTAFADDFVNYSVLYKQGMDFNTDDDVNDPSWMPLYTSDETITKDVLCSWDISSLEDGTYTLKLKVESTFQTDEDRTIIKFDRSSISGFWNIETVIDSFLDPYYTSIDIEIDNNDKPKIVYEKEEGGIICYAWRDTNGCWHSEEIGDTCVKSLSMDLDSNNDPHIVYYNKNGLRYAYRNISSWIFDTIDQDGMDRNDCTFDSCSIQIDSNDIPHVSYRGNNTLVKYATLIDDAWETSIVDSSLIDRDEGNCIAVDSNNRPYICYLKYVGAKYNFYANLKYAYLDGEDWQIETFDEGKIGQAGFGFDIDSNDIPHVVYMDFDTNDLTHSWRNKNDTWEKEIIVHISWGSMYHSLEIDDNDFLHVSFFYMEQLLDFDLGYARFDGTNWASEPADLPGWSGWLSDIAVDSNQLPHIIHYSNLDPRALRYSYLVDSPPNKPQLIEPSNFAVINSTNPELKVFISDPENDKINIKFFDNKTGEIIGQLKNKLSGSNQSIIWSNLTFSKVYEWHVVANDGFFENKSEVWTFAIDDTPPVTTHKVFGTKGFNDWYISDVTVTLEAKDDLCEEIDIFYCLDNGPMNKYTQPITINDDGYHKIYYYSIDCAGKQEETKQLDIKIDKILPETIVILPPNHSTGLPIYTNSVEIILEAFDYTSGINGTFYKVVPTVGIDRWYQYERPFIVSGEGSYTVYFYSIDNAGNREQIKSVSFRIVELSLQNSR